MATIHAQFNAALDNSQFLRSVGQMDSRFKAFVDGGAQGFAQIERANQRANATLERSNKAAQKFGRSGASNIAFQVQDIAVQLQAGQRVSQIISQQGSQLLSTFGVYGAILGAVTAIGAGIYEWVTNTKKAEEEAKRFGETIADFNKMTRETESMRIERGGDKFGAQEKRIRDEYLASIEALEMQALARERAGEEINVAEEKLKIAAQQQRMEERILGLKQEQAKAERDAAKKAKAERNAEDIENIELSKEERLLNMRGSADAKAMARLRMEEQVLRARIAIEEQTETQWRKTQFAIAANLKEQRALLESRTFGKTGADIQRQLRQERQQQRAEDRNRERLERNLGLTDIKRDISGNIIGGRDIITGDKIRLNKKAREERQKQFAAMFAPIKKPEPMKATIDADGVKALVDAINKQVGQLVLQ